MCRWVAYKGSPIYIEQLVTRPAHSLVHQSFSTEMNYGTDGSIWATNGDGFGVAWYGSLPEPGLFKGVRPAWNDENLHEICAQIKTRLFFAHIRLQTVGAVQRTNSHPFKYKNWIFQHNGHIDFFDVIKKDVQMEIRGDLFSQIRGTSDSETLFYLALTYGLEENPHEALKKAVKRFQTACADRKVEPNINLSCAISDGKTLYTLRYAVGDVAKTQFYSTDVESIQDLNGDADVTPEKSIIFVSEPLDYLGDKWIEVSDNTFSISKDGEVSFEKFM